MTASIDLREISLITDVALAPGQSQRWSAGFGGALPAEWRAAGQRSGLVIDHLEVRASRAELSRQDFTREVARATVERVLRQRRGQ